MKPREKWILVLAAISLLAVAGAYAAKFWTLPVSSAASDWAALGGYFGGLVGPILSFVLVWLVINEAAESRQNFLASKSLQVKSQDQVNEQIDLLTPRPELVYYPLQVGTWVYAVVENIGNATAYNIGITARPDRNPEDFNTATFESMSNPHYLPPRCRLSARAGARTLDNAIHGLPPHSVTLRYSRAIDTAIDQSKVYVVDDYMLACLHSEPDYTSTLQKIAGELQRLGQRR